MILTIISLMRTPLISLKKILYTPLLEVNTEKFNFNIVKNNILYTAKPTERQKRLSILGDSQAMQSES